MNIANKLTIFRVLLVPVFVIFYMQPDVSYQIAGALVFVLASATDFIDGHLARSRNLITTFGKFMDPLADKILTNAGFILLVEQGIIPAWTVIIIIAREFIISGFRILAAADNITIAASPYGKLKTIFQMVSLIWLLFLPVGLPIKLGLILYYISVVLTIVSGFDYIFKNKQILDLENI